VLTILGPFFVLIVAALDLIGAGPAGANLHMDIVMLSGELGQLSLVDALLPIADTEKEPCLSP